jgi:hypothetical protein
MWLLAHARLALRAPVLAGLAHIAASFLILSLSKGRWPTAFLLKL